jgi:hypothetical protein
MAIDYDTQILTLYAGNVGNDTDYTNQIPAALRDDDNEQRMLTTLEIVRSHMEKLSDRDEANSLHFAIYRMIAKMGRSSYNDLSIRVVSNNPAGVGDLQGGDDIEFVDTDNVVLDLITAANAPYALDIVSEINASVALGAVGISARLIDNRLVITQAAPAAGFGIRVGGSANNDNVTYKLGINPQQYRNKAVETANSARDDALRHYENEIREEILTG